MADELDDDHPLWLVNAQIEGLLEGQGASEDHENVVRFLTMTGLPSSTVKRIHEAICCAEVNRNKPVFIVDHIGTSYGEGMDHTTVLVGHAMNLESVKVKGTRLYMKGSHDEQGQDQSR